MATPRPKFRIDPTAPAAAPPPPPPPPAPVAAPPPLLAPTPAAPAKRRKWVVWAAVGAVVLLAGAAVAVFVVGVGGLVYPKKYLLDEKEMPRNMRLSGSDAANERCENARNPCKLTPASLDDLGSVGPRPKEGWVEGLDTPSSKDAPLTIVAVKFASADDASAWARLVSNFGCTMDGQRGALLRDGDVVVAISARTVEAQAYKGQVVTALEQKASGLRIVC